MNKPRNLRSTNEAKRQEVVRQQTSPFPLAAQSRVWVSGHNTVAKAEIERHLSDVIRPPTGPIDVALIAAASEEEAHYFAEKIRRRVRPGGTIWLIRARDETTHFPAQVDSLDTHLLGGYEAVMLSRS